jgi:predicted RND superfamily exporter protein
MIFDRLSIISTISPVMVLVVGVSDVVHLVTQFRHELARGKGRDEAIIVAFRQVGAACTLTSLTTFIGFGAMWFLPLPPSRELGVFAGLGVVSAFILSFLLTPVLLSFTKEEPAATKARQAPDIAGARMSVYLGRLADFIAPRTKPIIAIGLTTTVLVVGVVLQVQVENGLVRKIARSHPVRQALARLGDALGGAAQLEVLIDSGKPDGLKEPAMLVGLDEVFRRASLEPDVGESTSYVALIRRIHEILGPDGEDKTDLPSSRELVAQYLLLFEMQGGDDLAPLVDHTQRYARGSIRIGDMTAEEAVELAAKVDAWGAELLPKGASVETNGLGLLAARFGPRAKVSALQGFATAMLLIAVLLGLLFRSVKVGVLSLVPNVLPVAFGVSMVSVLYEQVDLDTLNFLAICLGIAVDDTIHFLARFRIERSKGLDRDAAVRCTILEAGHGIVRTSLILVAGFSVMILGDYMPISSGGTLLCLTLAAAVVVDLTLVPAMAQEGLLEPRTRGKVAAPQPLET